MFAMPQFVLDIDIFGAQIPTFNMMGRKNVTTSCGACASILILTVTFAFGLVKLQHLNERKNPAISTLVSPLEDEYSLNTGSDDFMMAFSAFQEGSQKQFNDQRYVRWQARLAVMDNGTMNMTQKLLHACTKEELARFNPPENTDIADKIQMQFTEGSLFCLDWKEEQRELWGNWRNLVNYSYIDVMLVPCASSLADAEECIWDKDQVIDYIGPIWHMDVYFNQQNFKPNTYGDDRIEKKMTKTTVRNI